MKDLADAFTGGDALDIVINKVSELNERIKEEQRSVVKKATKKKETKLEEVNIAKPIIVGNSKHVVDDMLATKINWYAFAIALVAPEKEVTDSKGNVKHVQLSADDCFHLLGVERKNNMMLEIE